VVLNLEGTIEGAWVTLLNPREERGVGILRLNVGSWGEPGLVDVLQRPLEDPEVDIQRGNEGYRISLPGRRLLRLRFPAAALAPGVAPIASASPVDEPKPSP
jgi:hypothetical protein